MRIVGSRRRIATVAAVILVVSTVLPAVVRAEPRRIDISGFVGLRTFAADSELGAQNLNDVKIVNSAIFGARVHYAITRPLLVEGEFPILISKTTEDIETLLVLFIHPRVQLTVDPMPQARWQPLASAGFGIASSDFVDEQELVPQGYLAAGVRLPKYMDWTARLDLRWILGPARDDGLANEFELLLSFYRPEPAQRKAAAQDTAERDTDGDGLLDTDDECPEEAEDMDKYFDDDGCPDPDNDNDTVVDADDKCPFKPETKNSYKDDDGCPDEVPQRIQGFTGRIEEITFETNSANLRPTSFPVLDRAVEVLKSYPELTLRIVGHTDDVATDEYNRDLSQRRAETVRDYLTSRGIDAARLEAIGKGESEPIDTNDTEDGRAKNRRVEFIIE